MKAYIGCHKASISPEELERRMFVKIMETQPSGTALETDLSVALVALRKVKKYDKVKAGPDRTTRKT